MSSFPIFIHSLFRSGSTYLFKVFRRSTTEYCCFQESIHEAVLGANDDPQILLIDKGNSLVSELRHPPLDREYYRELFEAWPAWKGTLPDAAVYDGYFGSPDEDNVISFLRALVHTAKGKPVFQECRTSGRIALIKEELGGTHIFLWRNPWDQWWSYKVAHYFNVANLLIINSPGAPKPVQLMRRALHIESWDHSSVIEGFSHYWNKVNSPRDSYLIFYMLWCLGMHEGLKHAEIIVSIDRLSDSKDYQAEILARFKEADIDGVDFSDCSVPQAYYPEKEQAFFLALEDQVHLWLIEGGWRQEDIERIQILRRQYQPTSWQLPASELSPIESVEQASRARALAIQLEEKMAEHALNDALKIKESEAKAEQTELRALHAENRSLQAEADIQQAESRALQAEELARQAESRVLQAEELARQAESRVLQAETALLQSTAQLDAVYNSSSWRITAPLRFLRKGLSWSKQIDTTSPRAAGFSLNATGRLVIAHGVAYAKNSPRFRRLALRLLNRMPSIIVKLRQIHLKNQPSANWFENTTPIDSGMPALSGDTTPAAGYLPPSSCGVNAQQRTPLESYFHFYGSRN